MELTTSIERFRDQTAGLSQLEMVRRPSETACRKCGVIGHSVKLPREGYWQCRDCRVADAGMSRLISPSYFAASTGGAPLEVVRQYLDQQRTSKAP